jgi:shikimate kinase
MTTEKAWAAFVLFMVFLVLTLALLAARLGETHRGRQLGQEAPQQRIERLTYERNEAWDSLRIMHERYDSLRAQKADWESCFREEP